MLLTIGPGDLLRVQYKNPKDVKVYHCENKICYDIHKDGKIKVISKKEIPFCKNYVLATKIKYYSYLGKEYSIKDENVLTCKDKIEK